MSRFYHLWLISLLCGNLFQPTYAQEQTGPLLLAQESFVFPFPEQKKHLSTAIIGNGERETLAVQVMSWSDIPFQTVWKQALDYSCGSAALATLLTHGYNEPTAEDTIFKTMFDAGDKTKIRQEGFSLLDMSLYLNKRGFKAAGYRLDLETLEKKEVPFIALINNDGYHHFVVVKSVKDSYVLVGDPSKGNVIYRRPDFAALWNGIALVITNYAARGRALFHNEKEWGYAHALALPTEGTAADDNMPALAPIPWQIAPAGTDILRSALVTATTLP